MAAHHRVRAVVGDLLGNAADRLEGCHVAAHNCLHVLLEDEPRRDQPAVAKHEREQLHDPRHRGLVGEDDLEVSIVDLSLVSRRRLEANLECRQWRWSQFTKQIRDGRVAAGVTVLAPLAGQAPGRPWPLPQVWHERINQSRRRCAAHTPEAPAAGDRSANRLPVPTRGQSPRLTAPVDEGRTSSQRPQA